MTLISCWKELPVKDRIVYIFSALSFVLGWVITFFGFYAPPVGVVDNTVIVVFGQAMLFAGCGFGLTQYVEYQIAKYHNKTLTKTMTKTEEDDAAKSISQNGTN